MLDLDNVLVIAVLHTRSRGAQPEVTTAGELGQERLADAASATEGEEVAGREIEYVIVPAWLEHVEADLFSVGIHGLLEPLEERRLVLLHGRTAELLALQHLLEERFIVNHLVVRGEAKRDEGLTKTLAQVQKKNRKRNISFRGASMYTLASDLSSPRIYILGIYVTVDLQNTEV